MKCPSLAEFFFVSTDQSQNYLFVFAAMENHIRSISMRFLLWFRGIIAMVLLWCIYVVLWFLTWYCPQSDTIKWQQVYTHHIDVAHEKCKPLKWRNRNRKKRTKKAADMRQTAMLTMLFEQRKIHRKLFGIKCVFAGLGCA